MNQHPASITLPLPELLQASGSCLDPKDTIHGATVRIPAEDLASDSSVEVSWVMGDMHIKPLKCPGDSTFLEYTLTAREVAIGIGREAYLSYAVNTGDQTFYSPALRLRIGVLSDVPSPGILQAMGDFLDLMTFSGDADLIAPLPGFCEVGDKIWLDCCYKNADGTTIVSRLADGVPATQDDIDNGWRTRIRRTLIESIVHKSNMVFVTQVELEGTCCRPPLLLPPLSLTKLGFVHHEDFNAQPTALIVAGQRIETPLMNIELLSGALQAGIINYPTEVPQMRSGQCIVLCNKHGGILNPAQILSLELKTPYRRIRFALTSLHGDAEFFFYDADDQLQGALSKRATTGIDQWVEFQSIGKPVGRIEVKTGDYCFLDNFTLWG